MSLQTYAKRKYEKDGRLKQVEKYEDGMAKQCYADECDIQKIMAKFEKTGTISHIQKYEGVYGDFAEVDFIGLTETLTKGREMFDDLPGELRQEFQNSPAAFFQYVNDPKNKDDLLKKLPALAAPGTQHKAAPLQTANAEKAETVKNTVVDGTGSPEATAKPKPISEGGESTSEAAGQAE